MDRLPLEIKHLIAKWTGDESKGSLQALSQVNREWNRISGSLLYHHIIIRLRDGETPHKLLYLPDALRALTQVRRLSIVAEYRIHPRNLYNPYHHIRDVLEKVNLADAPIPRISGYSPGDWAPIIDLIRQLPCLHDLNILVQNGGPLKLFEALSQYQPTCRVSIFTAWTFFNRGDLCNAWLLSPLLHAVHFTCFENPNHRMFCEHPDRILQRIVLLAPHVRQIALQISAFGERGPQEDFNETIKLKPQTEIKETPFPAKIESLSWPLNTKMTAEQFQELQKITDFSFLRSWTVGCIEDSTLLQTIVNIHPFRQLSRLTLALFQPEADDQGFWPAAESMFKSLPPLTYLCLLGAYAPNFLSGAVLCWHGPTLLELKVHKGSHTWTDQDLRRLSGKGQIGPIFSSQDILEVAGQCPSLRKLWICLQRYRGLESDVYAALGRFPCLVELDLVLNCVPEMGVNKMPITPRDLTEFEKGLIADRWNECLRWFTRDCMINCAIDETLAKAIFTHILANQDARRLLQLRIHPLYGQRKKYSYNGPGGRNRALHFDFEFLKLLAPTWTVKLEFLTGLRATKCVQPRLHPDRFQDDTLSIFKSIWTTEPDANTWPLDWHSWPLQSV